MSSILIKREFALSVPSNQVKQRRSCVLLRNEYKNKILEVPLSGIREASLYLYRKGNTTQSITFSLALLQSGIEVTSVALQASSVLSSPDFLVTLSGGVIPYNLLKLSGTGLDLNTTGSAFYGLVAVSITRAANLLTQPPFVRPEVEISLPIRLLPGEEISLLLSRGAGQNWIWLRGGLTLDANLLPV